MQKTYEAKMICRVVLRKAPPGDLPTELLDLHHRFIDLFVKEEQAVKAYFKQLFVDVYLSDNDETAISLFNTEDPDQLLVRVSEKCGTDVNQFFKVLYGGEPLPPDSDIDIDMNRNYLESCFGPLEIEEADFDQT